MHLLIDLCDPQDSSDTVTLEFKLFDHTIVHRWADKVRLAQKLNYPIDDPQRFYGFDHKEIEKHKALRLLQESIDTINGFRPLIDRKIESVDDQDTLNYLHHIFEEHHGLLDQQNSEFWNQATPEVRKALANLNIYVHRCESAVSSLPRMVVTYYGLPKVCKLNRTDYGLFTPYIEFGDLYLNYVEIGKTITDLWHDDDRYIHDDAFRAFEHFSADFGVRFHDSDRADRLDRYESVIGYHTKHKDFFDRLGYSLPDNRLTYASNLILGRLTYSDKEHILEQVRTHQHVLSVRFE